MRKYLTAHCVSDVHWHVLFTHWERTIVHLLERDHRVCRQIVLRFLVEEEGLWSHGPLLGGRRRHRGVLVARIHGEGGGRRGRPGMRSGRRRYSAGRNVDFERRDGLASISNSVMSRSAPV